MYKESLTRKTSFASPRRISPYLSEAFPNPRRLDCPPDAELIGLAERPREVDPFIPRHLTCCSPCFNRYMEILADMKERRNAG